MNKSVYSILLGLCLLTTSCTTTFAGSVFIFTLKDIILYVLLAFVFAILLGLQSENKRKTFWIWFAVGTLLTPLSSFVALLVKISK